MTKLFETHNGLKIYGEDITKAEIDILLEDKNGNTFEVNMLDLINFIAMREAYIEHLLDEDE